MKQVALLILLFWWCGFFPGGIHAQTLTEKLLLQEPAKLIEAARKEGDIVRGAILYHQGNINCAKCHRPSAENERIGPDISQLGPDVTDEHVVESILQPSRKIKEGFETKVVLTVDGDTVQGIVVRQDSKEVVLRDRDNVDNLITISRDEIDEMRTGTKSSMPDGLVDELKDRRQFLDLVRYVLDVKERGPTADLGMATQVTRRTLAPELQGLVLLHELNCVACHQTETNLASMSAKKAPDLKWSGKWLNPEHLVEFIADPHAIKPGTTMPHVLSSLDELSRRSVAEAITCYLVANTEEPFQVQPIELPRVARGEELFHSVGCVACHSPRDKLATEKPIPGSIALGDLSNKYNVAGLVEFLENPLASRVSGRMPNMRLTHFEARDISNFLLQKTEEPQTTWKFSPVMARRGRDLFVKHNCIACHADPEGRRVPPPSSIPLEQLRPGQGCLSGTSGKDWPQFQLAKDDVVAIQAALKNFPDRLTASQQIDATLVTYNCISCHDRDNLGGVVSARNPHFQTTNLNLGEQGRIPPTLTGVGSKLKPKWLRDVLVNGRVIRPYMKTRMPQFGESNIGHLVKLFDETDELSETRFASFEDQKTMREQGLSMAGNKGLNCVACHTYRYKLSDTMPAVDLTEMSERLKKDWFYQYMMAPQKFSPNTVMPSFWPNGVAIRKDIEGDPEFQIEALWQYLIDGRQARAPRGVVREPLEIVVTDQAQMLRRSYPKIGKRGIGVGYPGNVNLAFDAEQMRLGMVWRGKFADPAGVWRGQGHGNVRPIGRPIHFSKGPDLDDRIDPWPVDDGRPPDHKFLGYQLDKKQRPIFRYQFDGADVNDFFIELGPSTDRPSLQRRVTIKSLDERRALRFRIASAPSIKIVDDRVFRIDEQQLEVRIVTNQKAEVVDEPDGQRLQVSFDLSPDEDLDLIVEYSWPETEK